MSNDLIGAALRRHDAAGSAYAPQTGAEPSGMLTDIATAIEGLETLLAPWRAAPESSDAMERIADIAFVLHERDVEPSLCDALDAAVRELNDANAVKKANVQSVRQAAELLRELSQRIATMIAVLQCSPPPVANDMATEAEPAEPRPPMADQPASEDVLDAEIPREGLFAAELLEDGEFARAVAELVASLPALAEPVEAVVVTLGEPADRAGDKADIPPEPTEAMAAAQPESPGFAAEEPAIAPKSEEAISEARETADLAAHEAALTSEPEEAVVEESPETADLGADEVVLAPEPEEAVVEAQRENADLVADESALTREQEVPMGDVPSAIEQAAAERSSIAEVTNEQRAPGHTISPPDAHLEEPKNEEISNAMLSSEEATSKTPSGEVQLKNADAAAPPDVPGASPERVLASADAFVAPPDSDPQCGPTESLSTVAPEAVPDALSGAGAELELPPLSDAHSFPAPIADAITSEQQWVQSMGRLNGGDKPAQTVGEANGHDTDPVAPQTAANTSEGSPPRVTESSQSLLPELALVDPQDDPGDLFEPLAGAAAPIAANLASEFSVPAPAMRAQSPAAAPDPLAAMRALSAEELLALFT